MPLSRVSITVDCIEKAGSRCCQFLTRPRGGWLGSGINITMIIFNFTERWESEPDTQTGGQATISRLETRQTSAVRFRDLGTRTRDQDQRCWDGNILEMADTEGCGASQAQCPANTESVSWKVQSVPCCPCWAQRWLTFITFYNTPNIS